MAISLNPTVIKMVSFVKGKPKTAAWLCDKMKIELHQLLMILDGSGSDYFKYHINTKEPMKSTIMLSDKGEELIALAEKKDGVFACAMALALIAFTGVAYLYWVGRKSV